MSTSDQDTVIEIKQLKLIRGYRALIKNLSFQLKKGQAIHLKGRNGSGKTSLLKILNTSLKPTAGEIKIFHKNLFELNHKDYQQIIYLGHQTAIKPTLTVLENLKLNSEIFDCTKPSQADLDYALEQVELQKFKNQLTSQLSAGQKRRTMLARLFLKPNAQKSLWLLDEPLTALDVDAIARLEKHVSTHLKNHGSVIYTSHQPLSLTPPAMTLVLGENS